MKQSFCIHLVDPRLTILVTRFDSFYVLMTGEQLKRHRGEVINVKIPINFKTKSCFGFE